MKNFQHNYYIKNTHHAKCEWECGAMETYVLKMRMSSHTIMFETFGSFLKQIQTQENIIQPLKRRKTWHLQQRDELGGHYAKWNKPDRERQLLYGIIYIRKLKNVKL